MDSINFYKYHGCGNDFVLIEDYRNTFLANYRNKIDSICRPHYGIGADGILLIQSSKLADAKMRIFNPDGAEAKMCGNGLRCIAKHLGNKSSTIETNAGICFANLKGELVRATLPTSQILADSVSLPMDMTGYFIFTGTEHLVIFVDDINTKEFLELARLYRHHEMFHPYGVNVNFAKIESPDLILFRTFEKGVERETTSCGTGGAAVALAYRTISKQKSVRLVSSKKEELVFSFDNNDTLWMLGPADLVFSGVFVPKKNLVH